MKQRLLTRGLQRQYTVGDGNCLFTAVARALGFPDDAHAELRHEVVAFLSKHSMEFAEFQTDGWKKYLESLARGEWGDYLCLLAMSRMFGCRFTVVSDNEAGTVEPRPLPERIRPFRERA